MFKKVVFSTLLLLLFPFAVIAKESPIAVISSLAEPFDLAPFIETIEDPGFEYTLGDIEGGRYDHLWQLNTSPTFIGEKIESKYWYRISFRWQGQAVEQGILSLRSHSSLLYHLGLVLPQQGDAPKQVVHTGSTEPYDTRMISSLRYGFPLLLSSNETTTVVGWADNRNSSFPLHLPFYLQKEADFTQENLLILGLSIAFYAAMGALLLYNFSLFLTLRHSMYGLYLVFLGSVLVNCAIADGITASWWWVDQPLSKIRIVNITTMTAFMAYLAFVVSSLGTMRQNDIYTKLSSGLMGAGVLCLFIIAAIDSMTVRNTINQVYAGTVSTFSLVIILQALWKRVPTAGYLLLVELSAIAGGTCFILMMQGALPVNPATLWSMHIGYGTEAFLLSLALAERTRLAQQSAIDNLQKYEKIYNNSMEGLFQYDFKSKSLKCNDALAHLFGYGNSSELPVNSNILSYFSEEVQEELPVLLMEQGFIQSFEAEVNKENSDKKIWVSMTIRLVMNSNGQAIGTEGSMVDISQKKLKEKAEKQQAMAQKNEEISEAKNKAKTQFFASMSHEFRAPLTAILGYTKIAQGEPLQETERIGHIKTIENSAEHMLQLINDVLDLSKIEAQKLEVEAINVDLLKLSQEVHDFIWILASQKGISFSIDYQLPLPEKFISDPIRLKQALINLCSNSVKFTHKGRVKLHISCDKERESLSFAVEDTGIGLKPEQTKRLFKAFEQAESTTSRTFGGTGLGLHLSMLIAKKLGGDINVESEFGQGSTFTLDVETGNLEGVSWLNEVQVNLRKSDSDAQASGDSFSEDAHTETSQSAETSDAVDEDGLIKVLLAEDNEVNQTLMQFQIKQKGAHVVVANDGLEAIAHALLDDYGLILMDMDMPRMDGMTAVRFLRDNDLNTPIIALTGNVSAESIQECKDAGCNGHLAKPVDIEKLKSVIDSIQSQPDGKLLQSIHFGFDTNVDQRLQ